MGFSDSSPVEETETFVPVNVLNQDRQRAHCLRNVLYCVKEPTAANGLMGIPSVKNWVTYNFSIFVDFCYLKPFAASSQVPEEWGIEIQQVAWLALSNRCRRSTPNVLSPTSPSVLTHPPPPHTHKHTHVFSCPVLLERLT